MTDDVDEEKRQAQQRDAAFSQKEHRVIVQGGPSASPGLMAQNTSYPPAGSDVDAQKRHAQEEHAARMMQVTHGQDGLTNQGSRVWFPVICKSVRKNFSYLCALSSYKNT